MIYMSDFNSENQLFQKIYDNDSMVWMGQNTTHFPTPEAIKQAMVTAINKEEYHKYAPPCGFEELRTLIRQDLSLSADHNVHVTEGGTESVSYTHLRAHETDSYLVCRLLLEKKKKH